MRSFLLLISLALTALAQNRQVAITIDDLPRGGDLPSGRTFAALEPMTRKLLAPLRGVPVIGFVNGSRSGNLSEAEFQSILRIWLDHGADLGNHTWSHPDLNDTPLEAYEADLVRGEAPVSQALGHRPVFFRHPFLHTGPDKAKRDGLEAFLAAHGYRVAPITLDTSDWMFAAVYAPAVRKDPALAARVKQAYLEYMESIFAFFEERSREVVGREPAQTLLIHASQLNADAMADLLAMMRRRGYAFVSLETALKDPAYRLPDEYYGTGGFSWIHRWSKTKGMPEKGEPSEPAWIQKAFKER